MQRHYFGAFMKLAIICTVLAFASAANAQSVVKSATGVVGSATSVVGSATGTLSGSPDFSALNNTGSMGGDWNGGTNARVGGKDVTIRGAVATEGNGSAFKAGAGFKF